MAYVELNYYFFSGMGVGAGISSPTEDRQKNTNITDFETVLSAGQKGGGGASKGNSNEYCHIIKRVLGQYDKRQSPVRTSQSAESNFNYILTPS